MVRLRAFEETDLTAAYELDQICFPPNIAYSRRELQYFVTRPSAYAVVVEDTETPALLAGFLIADHIQRRKAATIVTIDVTPQARRSGVATLLMEAAEAHYLLLGCIRLSLEVAVDNLGAQAFYARRGFVTAGTRRGYYNGVLDAFTMRKEIGPKHSVSGS